MRVGHALAGARFARPRSSRLPGPWVKLSARLRGYGLDAELAAGIASWRSPVHAARAVQLTSPRGRHMLASSLERLLKQAQWPRASSFGSAVVPISRAAVSAQRPQILALAARLRSGEPVADEGAARLRMLLSDGASPIYTRGRGDALACALEGVARCLEVPD